VPETECPDKFVFDRLPRILTGSLVGTRCYGCLHSLEVTIQADRFLGLLHLPVFMVLCQILDIRRDGVQGAVVNILTITEFMEATHPTEIVGQSLFRNMLFPEEEVLKVLK